MPIHPERADFDKDILAKLTVVLAKLWDANKPELFFPAVSAYAAMRQCEMLSEAITQLWHIRHKIDDLNETILSMLSELPEEDANEGQA